MSDQPKTTISSAIDVIRQDITKRKPELVAALANTIDPERFMRVALTSIATNTALLTCDRASLVQSVIEAAQCGLVTDRTLGEGSLVPFKGRAIFIPGYRGLIKLAIQSGSVSTIEAEVVHEKDSFSFEFGLTPLMHHQPAWTEADPGPLLGVYAIATMKDGAKRFIVMAKREIEAIRKRSPSGKNASGPWSTDYEEMAKKTAIRRLCKTIPLTPRADQALSQLENVEGGNLLNDPQESELECKLPPAPKEVPPEPEEKEKDITPPAKPKTKDGAPPPLDEKDEPPPPGDEDAPAPRRGKGVAKEAAGPVEDAQVSPPAPPAEVGVKPDDRIEQPEAEILREVLHDTKNPRQEIERIVEREVESVLTLTQAEYEKVLMQLAPERLQGAFFK